jgi:hypothetical protein
MARPSWCLKSTVINRSIVGFDSLRESKQVLGAGRRPLEDFRRSMVLQEVTRILREDM